MGLLAAVRWTVLRTATRPAYWALISLIWLVSPAVETLAPITISSKTAAFHGFIYELALLGSLVGAGFGLVALEGLEPLARGFRRAERWGAQAVALLAACLLGAAVVVGPVACLTRTIPAAPDLVACLRLVELQLLLVGVGLLLLRARLPRGMPALLLPVMTWILPALANDTSALARLADVFLFEPREGAPATRGADLALASGAAWVAILLAASLLADLRPRRTR